MSEAATDEPVMDTKSEPFHATSVLVPAATVTPVVGPTPRITIDCVLPVALMTM